MMFHFNPDDPDLVPVPLRLPEGIVSQIDAALEQCPTIHARAEFAELAILYALRSLSEDEAAIWMGGDDPALEA
jgi:hypothetical protein